MVSLFGLILNLGGVQAHSIRAQIKFKSLNYIHTQIKKKLLCNPIGNILVASEYFFSLLLNPKNLLLILGTGHLCWIIRRMDKILTQNRLR